MTKSSVPGVHTTPCLVIYSTSMHINEYFSLFVGTLDILQR